MFLQGRHFKNYLPVHSNKMDEARLTLTHKLLGMVRKGGSTLNLKARSGDPEKEIGDFLKDRNIRFILPEGQDPEEGAEQCAEI
jgi:hypothetical protein